MSRPSPAGRRSNKSEYIETVGLDSAHRCNARTFSCPYRRSIRDVKQQQLREKQETGNKISRRAHIEGKQNIMLGGKSVIMAGVHMRGDLHRKVEKHAEGDKEGPITAINIGR